MTHCSSSTDVSLVILAAGLGRRFGGDKPLGQRLLVKLSFQLLPAAMKPTHHGPYRTIDDLSDLPHHFLEFPAFLRDE